MTDDAVSDLDQLTTAFWDYYLESNPTEAHLLGVYRYAGYVEDGSRAAEDRQIEALRTFAADAEAIDPGGLDETQRLTRLVLEHTATAHADRLDARLEEFGADPIFGPQASLPVVMPECSIPDADRRRGDGRQGPRRSRRTTATSASGVREGVAPAGRRPRFAVDDTVAQIDALAGDAARRGPAAAHAPSRRASRTPTPGARACATVVEREVRPAMAGYRDTLRDEVPAARPRRRPVSADLAAPTATTPTTDDPLPHDARRDAPRRSTRSGLEQIAKLADEYRELGPEVLGTDDLAEIFAAAARRSGAAPHERRRHRDGVEGRAGQGDGRHGRLVRDPAPGAAATSRRTSPARSRSTSRRPRTAAAAASSS